MTELVSGVLKLTFGFLANKARAKISERLNDGDVTYEECRQLIVRELDDIKTKLHGLARKDLLSSILFLHDGINGMHQAIIQFQSSEDNTSESTEVDPPTNSLVRPESSRDTSSDSSPIKDAIALINAVKSLKIQSNTRFISACEKFKLAYEKATEAFANEALSIEDRIQASQVRMMARILEDLEDPDASVSDCLQYLKQLHDIGAIQGTFSVLMKGGIASWRNKAKRLDIASSVILMNQLLFDFVRKFTNLRPILEWPEISFSKGVCHPVFGEIFPFNKMAKFGLRSISLDPDFTFGEVITRRSAMNSKKEIIAENRDETIRILKPSGEVRTFCELPQVEDGLERFAVEMFIDAKDNLYVITCFKRSKDEWSYELFVFDKDGAKIHECLLSFLSNEKRNYIPSAINTDGMIAILDCLSNILYIGNLYDEFNVEKIFPLKEPILRIVYFDTKIITVGEQRIYSYAENGEFERELRIPGISSYFTFDSVSVAINYVTKRILVKYIDTVFRLSETGELIDDFWLGDREWLKYAKLVSHQNGAVALVRGSEVAFLQL